MQYVKAKEAQIIFGEHYQWNDVEADELDLGRRELGPTVDKPISWEQWGGMIERGRPESLVLYRLNPVQTKRRAPGPGPIRRVDWQPIAERFLGGRQVFIRVLSTCRTKPWHCSVDIHH